MIVDVVVSRVVVSINNIQEFLLCTSIICIRKGRKKGGKERNEGEGKGARERERERALNPCVCAGVGSLPRSCFQPLYLVFQS